MSEEAKTQSQRNRSYEQRLAESGAVRMPGGMLQADAAAALATLLESGYADSKTAVIARALIDARKATMFSRN